MFIKPGNILLCSFLLFSVSVSAQKKTTAKYPSLLWEITGNGLTKPSYLFGTMHVSNKLAFHLSDSFYMALKSVEAVALELNPDTWQGEMVSMNNIKENYADFTRAPRGNYLTENSFRIDKYEDELKAAMSSEPTVVNSLLYRSYKPKEDFEEDTFLDLYIYQSGKKLGKRATGVENYFETEKIVMEAYADMAKEKKRKKIDIDESRYDILEKTQDAYRRGDLDLMDSLDRMLDRSEAFMEKFLFKRNEIQAYSMDTIMKKNSLFAGVGAAHLPGPRGVIELLRKMGYTLRPIQMTDRDAAQKEVVDKMKVPVNFTTHTSDDGFFSVAMPGPLFKLSAESQKLDRRQYSDMANGSYYLVTRIKTHAAFLGHTEKDVLNKVDSILYENIPGKILSKKQIIKNGYTGFDISNRTRRGDLQRYNIFVTPSEVLFFKTGGKENYVDGAEAEQFFSSIKLKEAGQVPVIFQPAHGEFSVKLPQQPTEYLNTINSDMNDRWEYEAVDKTTGDAYVIFKKSLHNFRFLDEDNFELGLLEESFRNPDHFEKQLSREFKSFRDYPALDVKEKQKDGSTVHARYIIRGPHYYVIAAKSKSKKADFSSYFNSFNFLPFKYNAATVYVDTFMHFTVNTPVAPRLNNEVRQITENAVTANAASGYFNYWPKAKNGSFMSNTTGEMIGVSVQEFPKYYYAKDSAAFLADEMKTYFDNAGLVLYKTDTLNLKHDVKGFRYSLRDTGSSRAINRMLLLKDNYTFSLVSLGDTIAEQSGFIKSFYSSIMPAEKKLGRSIYENRLDEFMEDLFSKDSATQKKAQQSIPNIYFGEKGVPQIAAILQKLNLSNKDYFDSKVKLVSELGYIKDTIKETVVPLLKNIFEKTADTSVFQNEVFKALARHKTQKAYSLFKELILQEPPVFSDNYEYSSLFRSLGDSLLLARTLFPELLQLSSLNDYKDHVLSLLVTLVDSNLIKGADYESYFTKIYFDAKVELKKLQIKDEKTLEKELLKEDDDNSGVKYTPVYSSYNKSGLDDYSVLLLPFYEKRKNVQLFFERLLQSREPEVRMTAAVLMLRNNIPVADSIITNLAADNLHRSKLYTKMEKAKRLDKFPAKYKDQLEMAKSFLLADKNYARVDSIIFIKKQVTSYLDKKGVVYFFKYRVNKEDDWKIGISGLQPEDEKGIYTDDKLTSMTDRKIKKDEPLGDQLQAQLKKILFSFHKSARNFYGSNSYSNYRAIDSYGD
ncbi:MAG: TraB/GumN family protein [Ferruginibacter sp.]|nr:TraB/GumN family protein [Ferruginibacter sp.]